MTLASSSHPIDGISVMGSVDKSTGEKRPPDDPYLCTESSPARFYRKTLCAGIDVPKVAICSIKITQVQSSTTSTKKPKKKKKNTKLSAPISANTYDPTSNESEEWWKVSHTIFLDCKGPNNRIKYHYDKAI